MNTRNFITVVAALAWLTWLPDRPASPLPTGAVNWACVAYGALAGAAVATGSLVGALGLTLGAINAGCFG